MKKQAVFGDPSGGFFEGMTPTPRLIRSVSSPVLKKEVFQSDSVLSMEERHDSPACLEEEKLMDKMNQQLFEYDGNKASTGYAAQESGVAFSLGGIKRTASGLTRRNVSSSNLSTMTLSLPQSSKLSPASLPLSPFGSCPNLKEAKKKQLRLERNRNAARLRRHKRRLMVETLAKEKNYMEMTLQFIKGLKKLMTDQFDPERLFGLPEGLVAHSMKNRKALQEHVNYLICCSSKNYQLVHNARITTRVEVSERSLLATIIGTPLEGKSWCPSAKQKAVEFFLYHQTYQTDLLQKIGRLNVLISLLSRKGAAEVLWLSDEQRAFLNGLIKGLVTGQIRLKLMHRVCSTLSSRISSGRMVVPFPTLESGMNAFRSVLTDDQLERFYRLAEETFAQKR